MFREYNFIHEIMPDTDKDLFFGPLKESDSFISFNDDFKLEHILVSCGIFPSLTQARKNIQNNKIPNGFSQILKKKQGILISILNKF